MRKILTTAILAAGLASAQPGLAQERQSPTDQSAKVMDMLGKLFVADPLTAEQETRLPAARRIAEAMMPEGFYGKMMSGMMDKFMGPLFDSMDPDMIRSQIARQVGLSGDDLPELGDAQLQEISSILDPVAARRAELMTGGIMKGMGVLFVKLEPAMREGVSRAYAVRFTGGELDDIGAFFMTPTGGKYASESMLLMADPQVMSGMMQALPAIMEDLPTVIEALKQEEARLPRPHRYADLTPAERAQLARLLGLSTAQLKTRMTDAEAKAEATGMQD